MKSLFISLFIGSKEFCNSPLSANTPCENQASSRAFSFAKFLSTLLLVLLSVGNVWGETVTETFENQTAGTSYQSTQNYASDDSNADIGWTIFYGSVSTYSAITGSKSAAMRLYYNNDNYGYLQSTTAIQGLTQITFYGKAQESNSGKIKINIQFSTNNGDTWTAMKQTSATGSNYTEVALTTMKTSYSAYIPKASISPSNNYLIKISINSNSTKPTSGNCQLTIDDIVFTYNSGYTITLNKNGGSANGSATLTDNATVLASLSAPTRTGHQIEGYYTDEECTQKIATTAGALLPNVTVSSTPWTNSLSQWKKGGNATFYAKWEAKVCTITLDKNEGDVSGSATVTYGTSTVTVSSHASRTGYNLSGYYTSGGGTQVLNADGTFAGSNVSGYITSGNWSRDGNCTLYAHWTAKSYSVTWIVNGLEYTTGTPSSSVNHDSRISKIPTDPDPAEASCGDKFVGWTDVEDYVHGSSSLFTTADRAPIASGPQVFYAVFADYDE